MKSSDKETAREILTLLLDAQKAGTVRSTFKRLAPGEDGRIRTVLSPGGTETGRLSAGTSFLEKSTNLQNLPKKVAKLDPLYNVRAIIVADPGRIFWAADYSSAESPAGLHCPRAPRYQAD
jgi:DNA polymerase I-like protein with 3'-5' exonuclease and polymerase domains